MFILVKNRKSTYMINQIKNTLRRTALRTGWKIADIVRSVKRQLVTPVHKIREWQKRKQERTERMRIEAEVKKLKEKFMGMLSDPTFQRKINEEQQRLAEEGKTLKLKLKIITQEEIDPLAIEAYRLSLNQVEKPTEEQQRLRKKEIGYLRRKIAIRLFLENIQTSPQIKHEFLQELEKIV